MAETITFTAKADNAFYTVDEINAFFAAVAAVLNQKVDVEEPSTLSDLNVGGAAVVNVAAGEDDTDAINYGQLLDMVPE